jgi:hypothetical protein
MMKTPLMILALGAMVISAATADEKVFNGKNLDGWMVVPEAPPVWRVIKDRKSGEPMIARQPGGSYLWTKEKFGDFVLEMEYKVSQGCNSGVFFRTDPGNPVQGGFEIQIFDSHGQEPTTHNTGAFYDARAASSMPEKPAGQWNTFRLECKGPMITVAINGTQVQDINVDDWDTPNKNPDGSKNKFKTALKDLPRVGHIGFQDHGHNVWYRKITIKKL